MVYVQTKEGGYGSHRLPNFALAGFRSPISTGGNLTKVRPIGVGVFGHRICIRSFNVVLCILQVVGALVVLPLINFSFRNLGGRAQVF